MNTLLLLLTLLLIPRIATTARLTVQELEAALTALRLNGYTLFPNAIATSDLRYKLLSSSPQNSTFTLFSPPDPLLFSVDLSTTAPLYTLALLRHVLPSRLSRSDFLRRINHDHWPYVDTLSPPHRLLIGRALAIVNGTVLESVALDGVRVSVPDLFLGSSIAVHGLDGILVGPFGSGHEDAVGVSALPPDVWSESNSRLNRMANSGHWRGNGHGRFAKFNHQFGSGGPGD